MKTFVFYDDRGGDIFEEWFDTADEAVEAAEMEWYHLTPREREKRQSFFVARVTADSFDEVAGGWNGEYEEIIREWK